MVELYKPWAWLEIASCNCIGLSRVQLRIYGMLIRWAYLAGYTDSGNTVDFDIAAVADFGTGDFAAAAAVVVEHWEVGTSAAAAAAVDFEVGMLAAGRSFRRSAGPVADCKIGLMVGIVTVVGPSGAISIQPSRCVSW